MGATILIPTRDRPAYLDVVLSSVVGQAREADGEVIVVDDGCDVATAQMTARHGVRRLVGDRRGANTARNVGIAATEGDPVVFIDDDVRAPNGWLEAMLGGIAGAPDHDVFGGPIHAALEGGGPRSCGREAAPITTLDLGPNDRDAEFVWSANMAIRRAALMRVGSFDETIHGRGEEEDWERRYVAAGGRIRYLAGAGLEHRRVGPDARLDALSRSAYALGRTARRYDRRKGTVPTLGAEAHTLAGCVGHVARYRCPNMLTGVAHTAGRIHEALTEPRA